MRAFALALLAIGSMDIPLDRQAIDEALTMANSSLEQNHVRFHADYQLSTSAPPVDFVSVVTPFRRVVLAAETASRQGRRMFGQREALAALQPDAGRVEIFAELTFHPHNTFIGVPDYAIELQPISSRGTPVLPVSVDRLPRFGPRFDAKWYPFPYPYTLPQQPLAGSQPLLGGTIIARLNGDMLNPKAAYDIVVKDGSRELARARVDFARLR